MSEQIFYVGDEVKVDGYGNGVVVDVFQDDYYSIKVKFTEATIKFTNEGREHLTGPVVLTFRDGGINYGTPPKREWVPTKAQWANVWDEDGGSKIMIWITNYKAQDFLPYIANGLGWKHAEPCEGPKWKGATKNDHM